jgi:hypothetical protein
VLHKSRNIFALVHAVLRRWGALCLDNPEDLEVVLVHGGER